jgi:hypothetical protein
MFNNYLGVIMKKLWMVLLVLLVIGIGTAGAQIWQTNAPANYKLSMPKNEWAPGYEGSVKNSWLFAGKRVGGAGEEYELEITFKASREFKGLDIVMADLTEKADWWLELSDYFSTDETIPANTDVTKKFTFTTVAKSTGTSGAANALSFNTQGSNAAITLTFSKFTLTRIK